MTDEGTLYLNHGTDKGFGVGEEFKAPLCAALEQGIVPLH